VTPCSCSCGTNPHTTCWLPLSPPFAPLQVQCCIRCLSQGVNAAHIIDGRSKHSVLMELLTDEVSCGVGG
jgi:hypothetical protein